VQGNNEVQTCHNMAWDRRSRLRWNNILFPMAAKYF